jgi:NAD(P)-dependent dehydrogenase (short-subunit alcohol dehydrogenase family)
MMTANQQSDLAGLRGLVTGATSGLGRAIAFQLARDGADVIVHGRDAARGVQTVGEVQLQSGTAHFVAADLADATSIAGLADEVGDIDILVNNAGFAVWGPTETLRSLRSIRCSSPTLGRRSSSSRRSRQACFLAAR